MLDEIDIKNKERVITALTSEDEKIHDEAVEKAVKLLAKLDELCPPKPMLRLKPRRAKTTVFDSKIGGAPYFPKNMEYPTVREGSGKGKPLYLLAQLNFGTLPKIEGFPGEGSLRGTIITTMTICSEWITMTAQTRTSFARSITKMSSPTPRS